MNFDDSESIGEWLEREGEDRVDAEVGRLLEQMRATQMRPFEAIARSVAAVSAAIEAYPEKVRPGLQEMNRHGWYVDHAMPAGLPGRFKAALDAGDSPLAEQKMLDHFQRRADGILLELTERHPHRQEVFRAAFAAHSSGQYLLAIPVILAQVDGLCFDASGGYLFMASKRKPVMDHLSSLDTTPLAKSFSEALLSPMPVTASAKDRPADFSGMNRHQILHGEVVDYGSKENSMRAISLLGYVSERLSRAQDEATDDRSTGAIASNGEE